MGTRLNAILARKSIDVLKVSGVLPIFLFAALLIFGIISKDFYATHNILNMLRQSTFLAIISVGQAFTILVGGFDLTVGVQVALASIVSTKIMLTIGDPVSAIIIGILCGIICGILIGACNGIIIAFFKVSPFIVTLAMMEIVHGVVLVISKGAPVFGFTQLFSEVFGYGKIAGLPVVVVITLFVAFIMYFWLNKTTLGIYFWALGGNENATRLSGISVLRYKFYAYLLCGGLGGLTGVLLTARVNSGEPLLGEPLVLKSITAAVLGGVAIGGGRGNIPGVLLGAFFMGLLGNGMNLANIGSYAQQIITGILLLIAIVTDRYIHGD